MAETEIMNITMAVYEKTLGNPFYVIEFLKYCNQEKLFYYDSYQKRWKCNALEIYKSKITENVVDFLLHKMQNLPGNTKELISIAACIGNQFEIKVLSAVTLKSIKKIEDELRAAIAMEMIYLSGNKEGELQFQFCHDKFQQAGYQALAADLKKTMHLKIAEYYQKREVLDETTYLFLIAEHYVKAVDCIDSTTRNGRVIALLLKAAHAANLSSAFDTARQYIELILAISPEMLNRRTDF